MNYQTMQHQARGKHRQLRQEAKRHRLVRQTKTGHSDPVRSKYPIKLAGAFVSLATIAAVVITLF